MVLEIKKQLATIERGVMSSLSNMEEHLCERAANHELKWLLAHADDGVIWGIVENGALFTSHIVAADVSPKLMTDTLQQARLFSEQKELLLWRDGNDSDRNSWCWRLICDVDEAEQCEWEEAIDERYLLIGTRAEPLEQGFTLLWEGAQGLRHAIPIPDIPQKGDEAQPPRLKIRHYLAKEDFARIAASRLAGFDMEGRDR